LSFWCEDLVELREFLRGCKYVSDVEQFGEKDYWQPPDEFEKTKAGDCEDFALWAWRQLVHMNYPARFVVGSASRYGEGHAWVRFAKDGKIYLLEPLARGVPPGMAGTTSIFVTTCKAAAPSSITSRPEILVMQEMPSKSRCGTTFHLCRQARQPRRVLTP
jgi:hypothetical protein